MKDFNAWLKAWSGYTINELYAFACSIGTVSIYYKMMDLYQKRYEEAQLKDFNAWLKARSGHTAGELYTLACATGTASDYYKMMDWYQNRYELETENPFLTEAETSENGEKNA